MNENNELPPVRVYLKQLDPKSRNTELWAEDTVGGTDRKMGDIEYDEARSMRWKLTISFVTWDTGIPAEEGVGAASAYFLTHKSAARAAAGAFKYWWRGVNVQRDPDV